MNNLTARIGNASTSLEGKNIDNVLACARLTHYFHIHHSTIFISFGSSCLANAQSDHLLVTAAIPLLTSHSIVFVLSTYLEQHQTYCLLEYEPAHEVSMASPFGPLCFAAFLSALHASIFAFNSVFGTTSSIFSGARLNGSVGSLSR